MIGEVTRQGGRQPGLVVELYLSWIQIYIWAKVAYWTARKLLKKSAKYPKSCYLTYISWYFKDKRQLEALFYVFHKKC